FGVYEPDDRQVWMKLASDWVSDPRGAAGLMQQIAQAVLGEEEGPTAGSPQPPATAADTGTGLSELTPDQVQQMIAEAMGERERVAAEERAVEGVYAELRAGGYDPSSMEGFMVLWLANNGTNGDIGAAMNQM